MRGSRFVASGLLVALLGLAMPLAAQTVRTGSISGTVKDDTGGTLPGVTVTLTSPALQLGEVVRVTDGQGGYQFVDLPLGTYRVVFDLSSFSKLIRDNIELPTGFAARIDAVLKLASVQETVTVSGQSPVVDITNTRGGARLTKDMLESIPNNRTTNDIIMMTPGMVPSTPPQTGQIGFGALASGYRAYGLTGQEAVFMDGVSLQTNETPDFAIGEEVLTQSFGNTAEIPTAGAQIQIIVKSGGNDFHGRQKEEYMPKAFIADNVDNALRAQGISSGDALVWSHDFIGDLGGRIVRDKLWFFGSVRHQYNHRTITGYAKAPGPDGQYGTLDDVPGEPAAKNTEYTGKVSWQVTSKHKLIGFLNKGQPEDYESFGSRFIPYESTERLEYPNYRDKAEWQAAFTNRLLAEASVGDSWYNAYYFTPDSSLRKPSTLDRATQIQSGASWDARAGITRPRGNLQFNGSLSIFPTMLRASHELKTGFNIWRYRTATISPSQPHGDYQLVFDTVSGVPHQPVQLIVQNRPTNQEDRLNYYAAYVADTWRLTSRMTANVGLRWDRYTAYVPASVKPQGNFGEAGNFPRVEAGTWSGVAPRAGFAFDLTGDGKTVVKGTYGFFNYNFNYGFASVYNGNNATRTTYTWRDLNGNTDYDRGEVNLDVNGLDFVSLTGTTNPIINTDLKQPHIHELSASFERQLGSDMSARFLWVHKRQTGLVENINPLRPASAYNIPITRIDPGPDGVQGNGDDRGNVTIWDYNPAFRGGAFVGIEPVNRPSGRDDHANSFEVLFGKRSSRHWSAQTSFLATKNHRWITGVAQSPNDELFPLDQTWEWSYRASGSYTAPWGIQASAFYLLLNGAQGQRTYLFRNVPNSSTLTIRLEDYGASSGPRRGNLNLKVAKRLPLGGRRRLEVSLDALNATNNNVAWTTSYISGPTFGYATRIAVPRAVRLGVQFDF